MPWTDVRFQTTSSRKEIETYLINLGMIRYLSIQPVVKRSPMSDRKQVIIIWLLAVIVVMGVLLYIEWSTRP